MAVKYRVTYDDVSGVAHRIDIDVPGYGGAALKAEGRAWWTYTSDDSVLAPIRGSALRVELEADSTQDYSDLYGEDEMTIKVEYYRNNLLQFVGWLDSEGWYEDYANEEWVVSFDCYDGLGYLENLAYVTSTGLNYTGVQKPLDIVVNCLARTNLQLDIKVNIDMRYVGASSLVNIFDNCHFNAERFYQEDDEPMSCLDVLKSTLEVFNACITMREGQWFVYRPNDLYLGLPYITFFHYDYTGASAGAGVSTDLREAIGSYSDGYSRHHIEGNQRIVRKKALTSCQVNYKYGPATSLIGANKYWYNSTGTSVGYADWTVNSTSNMTIAAAGEYSVTLNNVALAAGILQLTSSATIAITATDTIKVSFTVRQSTYPFSNVHYFYYRVKHVNGGTTNYLKNDGTWTTTVTTLNEKFTGLETRTFSKDAVAVGASGNVSVEIYTPEGTPATGTMQILMTEMINTSEDTDVEGEFHKAVRSPNPTSKVEDEVEVFTGDTVNDTYVGAIYKADGTTNTDEWTRDVTAETKPLLQIMVEDRLRLAQETALVYTGSVFHGNLTYFVDFLSVCTINNFTDKLFMPTEYSYDTMTGIIQIKLHEIFADELADIEYSMTIDYGEPIKPVIRG